MDLALCLFKYFPYGGLQRNFLAIAQELMRRGHKVKIYTGRWDGAKAADLDVEILPFTGMTNHGRNRRFYTALQMALSSNPVDLVIGFNKMPGLDVYYCADTCFATKAYEEKGRLYRAAARSRHSLRYERAVFGSSAETQVLLLSANEGDAFKKYYGTATNRLHLMPPGISKNRIRTDDADKRGSAVRKTLGLTEKNKIITFLGSDYKRKGLDRLLRAVASLPETEKKNTRVLVIGKDKRQSQYEQLAKSLGISESVLFLGQRDDIPDLLFSSNCLAHPAYLENTGNVLLEATVAGLPVICSGKCGYAFYIAYNKLGKVLTEPFNQQEMNRLLPELLTDRERWQRHCAAFVASADIFSRPQRAAERIEIIGKQKCI
jgi:UDP-glucose:(heptosyl)LPS alpha-1,3-glucosyltransferase